MASDIDWATPLPSTSTWGVTTDFGQLNRGPSAASPSSSSPNLRGLTVEVANADANPSLNPGGSRHFPAVHAVWDARLCLSLADHAILAAHARGSRTFDPRLAHSGGAVRVEGPPGSCHSIAAHAVRDRRRCLSLADHATLAAHELATHASLAAHASARAISSTAAWVPRRCPSLAIRDSSKALDKYGIYCSNTYRSDQSPIYCQYLEGAGPGLVGVDSVSSDGRSIPGLRTLENRLKWAKIA